VGTGHRARSWGRASSNFVIALPLQPEQPSGDGRRELSVSGRILWIIIARRGRKPKNS